MRWFLGWCLLTLAITACGAVIGALLFPVGGWLFGMDLEFATMVRNGLSDGGFFAMIWAPGLSFVLCLIAFNRKSRHNA